MENAFQNTYDETPTRPYRSGSTRAFGPRGPRSRDNTQNSEPGSPGPNGYYAPTTHSSSPRTSLHSRESEPSSPALSLSQFESNTISAYSGSTVARPESVALEMELPPPRLTSNASSGAASITPKNERTPHLVAPKPATETVKSAILKVPPSLNFDVAPITHKGLPLDAAQWTLTTDELQQIVSRAIRLSARESFIRVLPVDTVDNVLAQEAERLATLRLSTQSKYRFQMHRRTMLLQSLVSCASAKPIDGSTLSALTVQLSEVTIACDRIMEELVHITDQQGQIKSMVELHWASALAIALRKLNKSYERKSTDLKEVKTRVAGLEAELAEAWAEADKLAAELDSLELSSQDGDDVIRSNGHLPSHAQVVEVKGRAIASEGRTIRTSTSLDEPQSFSHDQLFPSEDMTDNGEDALADKSSRQNRSGQIAAAKERSRRTSDAGLRTTRSIDHGYRPPPLPGMPTQALQGSAIDSPTLGPETPRPMPETRVSMQELPTMRNMPHDASYRFSVPPETSAESYLEL